MIRDLTRQFQNVSIPSLQTTLKIFSIYMLFVNLKICSSSLKTISLIFSLQGIQVKLYGIIFNFSIMMQLTIQLISFINILCIGDRSQWMSLSHNVRGVANFQIWSNGLKIKVYSKLKLVIRQWRLQGKGKERG